MKRVHDKLIDFQRSRKRLIILSAPSGAGKSTVIKRLLEKNKDIKFSVSYTTREIRKGEKDGVDYYFRSRESFEKMINSDRFLEWAKVHGNYYGTSIEESERLLEAGYNILLDIDVQGAMQIRSGPIRPIMIFILPPSKTEMIARLENRGDLTPEELNNRVSRARDEMMRASDYEYLIVNKDVEKTVSIIENIILSESHKTEYNKNLLQEVIETFT